MTTTPIDVLQPGAAIPRHRHDAPYAAVVLSGGYEEAGDGGRYLAEPGDVLIHAAFSAHLDRAPGRRTLVLNLPLPLLWARFSSRMRVDDPDAVARLAERNIRDGQALLLEALISGPEGFEDDADLLAKALSDSSPPPVSAWSREAGVVRQTAWRRFAGAYGTGPARYRVEARARRAWRRLVAGWEELSDIALAEGFADQAHMTRDVRALTGRTPGQWRALQHSFKTAAG
ncbi:AraC family transcriptional regulator [Brevundimonas sp.]|uniref:AraC family transcriptional regulator n=1 Tax=Brevundimonas sp. TaxID=1871086 RepID=UPI002D5208EB|nr:AraC family transcriptional regulator [Brevundimonas sp.]HYC97589.1 AraC family transcriptional regulator [Brevundimonas sp.]